VPEPSPARYVAVSFDAGAASAERWADALLAAGAASVDAAAAHADDGAARSGREADELPWPVVRLTALFRDTAPWQEALTCAAAQSGESMPAYIATTVADTDWVRAVQAQLQPIQVSHRLWIVPSWCEPPDPAATVVTLDPGLAFGTGSHASTLLCLRWLAAHLQPGASVLDYGCGSGILAIAAAKLGAGTVTGVDIDDDALAASRANAAVNAVTPAFTSPENLEPGAFDVVLANILASPLELLAPLLAGRVRTGGHVVLSGILSAQAGALLAAYERWFNIAPWGSSEGWVALAGVRHAG
jgi:ribosomal protein L11 methyltransferase